MDNINWIKDDTILTSSTVELIPLGKEHFPGLIEAANDKRIWEFYWFDGTDESKFTAFMNVSLDEKEKGTQYPFVIVHKPTNRIIGSTRFLDIQRENRKLEIGATWLHPDHWATSVNPECKLLLLRFCFEQLDTLRVQFKANELNIRSRKAIEKIGAKFEGILRNDMLRDGKKRNSAYFSIIDTEWKDAEADLHNLISRFG